MQENTDIPTVIAQVRETGAVNMFGKTNVAQVAKELGYEEISTEIEQMSNNEYSEYLQKSAGIE
jgi:hypothetical protein